MATAHLYECEDVAAALLYAYQTGDSKRAIAAASELYVSQETELLRNLLTLSWLLRPPERTTGYQVAAFLDNNLKNFALALADDQPYTLPPHVPDLPLPPLPSPSVSADCEWILPQLGAECATTLFRAVRISLRRRHWQHAVFLLTPYIHDATSMLSLFRCLKFPQPFVTLLESNLYDPLTHRIVLHTLAAVCHPERTKRKYATFPAAATLGARSGRTFSIPAEARAAWHIRPKPPSRLQQLPLHILDTNACAIWQNQVKTYGIRNVNQMFVADDDDTLEAFYSASFPEDIPDEWSNMERTKSHTIDEQPNVENPWIAAFHICWS